MDWWSFVCLLALQSVSKKSWLLEVTNQLSWSDYPCLGVMCDTIPGRHEQMSVQLGKDIDSIRAAMQSQCVCPAYAQDSGKHVSTYSQWTPAEALILQ